MTSGSKLFNITFDDLSSDKSREYSNILLYPYRMLKPYIKTPINSTSYKHRRANLVGEMYENLIYERLLTWASNTDSVSEFVLKGPYVNSYHIKADGLVYNSRNQIFYMSSNETVAEFDALFTFDGCHYFVEITTTDNKLLIEELEVESLRKFNLMRILFPGERLGYWIITTYQGPINFVRLPNVAISRTPKYNLDSDILRGDRKLKTFTAPNVSTFKTIQQVKYCSFDYLGVMSRIQDEVQNLPPVASITKMAELTIPYAGLIERAFLGKLSESDCKALLHERGQDTLIENIEIDHAIIALKMKAPPEANVVVYVVSRHKSIHEVDLAKSSIKTINIRKRTVRDVSHFDNGLKQITLQSAKEYLLSSNPEK